LWLKNLFLSNFRGFSHLELKLSPRLNILWGENGQGKTNFLEALYCLGHGISFRTNCDEELIKWGEKALYLKGEGIKSDRAFTYEFSLIRSSPKVRKVNSRRVNLRNPDKWLWMVVFTPEDLWLIKGPPSQRRNFLDSKLPFFNFHYSRLQSSYNKVLSQRNYLLSLGEKREVANHLESWDQQLVDLGSKIVKLRLEGLRKLEFFFKKIYPQVMNKESRVDLIYKCSFLRDFSPQMEVSCIKDAFRKELNLKREREIEKGMTLIGPHRDDFLVLINGVDLRSFGSQGEQRIAALSLKMAEIGLVKSREGDYPITLLDDIISELDPRRQKLLLSLIKSQSQIFITTTHPSLMEQIFMKDAYFFEVKKGDVRRR